MRIPEVGDRMIQIDFIGPSENPNVTVTEVFYDGSEIRIRHQHDGSARTRTNASLNCFKYPESNKDFMTDLLLKGGQHECKKEDSLFELETERRMEYRHRTLCG